MTEARAAPRPVLTGGRREPTEKMLDYMRHIEIWSGVPADAAAQHDFWSCHDYIAANEAEARQEYGRYLADRCRERRQSRRTTEYIGGDYGVANNDMGIDCFDFGVCPWGDS